jgi:hypothetical protein
MRISSPLAFVAICLLAAACGRTSAGRLLVDASHPDLATSDVRDTSAIDLKVGTNAIAEATCAPNDGGAVTVHIGVDRPSCDSGTSGPSLVVTLYSGWDYLHAGSYALDTDAWVGTASYSSAPGQRSETAIRAVLTIVSIDATRMVAHCEAQFSSGFIALDFVATWCGGYPLCG